MAVFEILKSMNGPDVTHEAYKNKNKNYKRQTAQVSTIAMPLHSGGE